MAVSAGMTSMTVAQVLQVSAIRGHGRTSVVFASSKPESAKVSSQSAREIRVTMPSSSCEAVRLRSDANDSLIDAVTVRCITGGVLEATIVTHRDVSASERSTPSHVYVDLTALIATASDASATSVIRTRAAALAAAGRVRDLIGLIDSLSAAERAAANRAEPSLDGLLQQARERKLELDRDLLLSDTRTQK
jgi:hypothetical protein